MTPTLRTIALSLLLSSPAVLIAQPPGFTNNPYTATKKTTIVQKLANGTTITLVNTTTEARDSQGRTMQQHSIQGPAGRETINTFVTDPIARTTTIWLSTSKQATRTYLLEPRRMQPPSGSSMGNGSVSGNVSGIGAVEPSSTAVLITGSLGSSAGIGGYTGDPNLRPTTQTEKLGGKSIAGVYTEGIRTTVTYPTGSFGNDRPIVVLNERWTSPDLKIIVLTINDDPRSGTQTTEITDLNRAEPDPALFQVPEGYTIKDQYPGSNLSVR
ncbi:hypothetical protein EDE15_4870 [Edaphobacter aggregans]|uniref:Outer membrane lipoprotein-sorting protein n=1 Tax=Edaphobacter aggregans TaxID=570835 RepID=A0A3R9PDE3_9BACT|nr:hypothetical protein [Edaphobacter aggregans]RSL19216.1 hypothetical protein EDE15_4870 [Edaphobacter aggregans]